MSQENVEIVQRSWEAWERRDMDALFEFYADDVEWDMTDYGVVDFGVYRGHAGIRQFFAEWLEGFADFHAEPVELIDAGNAVIAAIRQGGRGQTSAVEVDMPPYWAVYRMREGQAVRIEMYRTESAARASAAAFGVGDVTG